MMKEPPVVTGGSFIFIVGVWMLVDDPLCFFVAWCGADEKFFSSVKHDANVVGNAVIAEVGLIEVGVDGFDELENVEVVPYGVVERAWGTFVVGCAVGSVVECFQFVG